MTETITAIDEQPAAGGLFPQWPLSDPSGPPPSRVEWVTESPLCFVGGWEPLSFRKRAGYAWTDENAAFHGEFSDDALDQYVQLGATSIVIPYAKGFGHRATQHELDEEREITARAHAKGLRVGAYVRVDALVPESVRADYPDVDQWLMRGIDGRPSVYSSQQTFRRRVCYSHPRAVERLQEIFRYAVETLKIDLLHLDGYHVASAHTCRCERCHGQFRQWLRRRYPNPADIEATFGILDPNEVEIPLFDPAGPPPPIINSPDIRAWARFQWDRQLAFTRHLRRFVRSLNPNVAVSINPIFRVYWNASLMALEHVQPLLPWIDLIWTEDEFHLRFADNRVVSRIATFKLAREAGVPLCTYHWMKQPQRISASLALATAANGGHTSCLGFTFRYLPHVFLGRLEKARHAQWVRRHWNLLGNARPLGEIALVRHQPSLAWNGRQPWQAVVAFEALLDQRLRVPWRLFNAINHPGLNEVRTLLLPDAECLSQSELDCLHAWVKAGGRLLFTTRTARYDQDRRRRPRHPLLDWSAAWRDINNANGPETWFNWLNEEGGEFGKSDSPDADAWPQTPAISQLGEGRLGWWPALQYNTPITPHHCRPQDLLPPIDTEGIEQFIVDLHGPFSLRVDGPPQLLTEFGCPSRQQGRLIHLIRTNDSDQPISATIHVDRPLASEQIACLSPDDQPPRLDITDNVIRIDALKRYAVLHLPREHGR
ncbi:MAG: beta-galactosidase [Phycisphaerales bacterium]|nr:beta-galactosidase [Phycisphaerales bacterium]